jgi:hypothetical protein
LQSSASWSRCSRRHRRSRPRWGAIGKQKIEDAGELCPKRMETVDDEILDNALKFVDGARSVT